MTARKFNLERQFSLGVTTEMPEQKPNTLTLHDPLRAAVLMTCGVALLDCPANPHQAARMLFVFDDRQEVARLASAAIAEDRLLPIGKFLENLRKCNELLHLFRIARHGEGR
jgi:hypothetical protein